MIENEQIELIKEVDFDTNLDAATLEKLESIRQKFPYMEDRSAKIDYISTRCPCWLREDFEYVSRCIEGEDPSIVLRRLVRQYIKQSLS